MRSSGFLLFTLLLFLSAAFSSYSYRAEKKSLSLHEFVCKDTWTISESFWNGKPSSVNLSEYSLTLRKDRTFTCTDALGKAYGGEWHIVLGEEFNYLVLNPGSEIEEKYKIHSYDIRDGSLSLEKLYTATGESNLMFEMIASR